MNLDRIIIEGNEAKQVLVKDALEQIPQEVLGGLVDRGYFKAFISDDGLITVSGTLDQRHKEDYLKGKIGIKILGGMKVTPAGENLTYVEFGKRNYLVAVVV